MHAPATPVDVPVLESGDRLDRAEFRRRYEAQPHRRKAELIGGIVYVASPVHPKHGINHFGLTGWLNNYLLATPGTFGCDDTTVVVSEQDEPQPDILLGIRPELGGLSRFDEDEFLCGPVELVAEVASSSAAKDLHLKRDLYQTLGCLEYLVHVVAGPSAIVWLQLEGGRYRELDPIDGVLRSRVYPGLWLDVAACLRADWVAVDATLRRGLATPEHAAFVEALSRRK